MKFFLNMYHFIFLTVWVALKNCWFTFETDQKFDVKKIQNLQFKNSYTIKNNIILFQIVEFNKTINIILTFFMFMLIVIIYSFLIKYITTLSNEIILFSKFLKNNIIVILSLIWSNYFIKFQKNKIDQSQKNENVQFQKNILDLFFFWIFLYRNDQILLRNRQFFFVLNFRDVQKFFDFFIFKKRFMTIIKTFSSIMKNLIQIVIWNFVNFWFVVIMIVNTLIYDGFTNHNIIKNNAIRLMLIFIYAFANFEHQYRVIILFYRNFTFVFFQTCWTFIFKMFIFSDCLNYENFSKTIKKFDNDRFDML